MLHLSNIQPAEALLPRLLIEKHRIIRMDLFQEVISLYLIFHRFPRLEHPLVLKIDFVNLLRVIFSFFF